MANCNALTDAGPGNKAMARARCRARRVPGGQGPKRVRQKGRKQYQTTIVSTAHKKGPKQSMSHVQQCGGPHVVGGQRVLPRRRRTALPIANATTTHFVLIRVMHARNHSIELDSSVTSSRSLYRPVLLPRSLNPNRMAVSCLWRQLVSWCTAPAAGRAAACISNGACGAPSSLTRPPRL